VQERYLGLFAEALTLIGFPRGLVRTVEGFLVPDPQRPREDPVEDLLPGYADEDVAPAEIAWSLRVMFAENTTPNSGGKSLMRLPIRRLVVG